MNSLYKAGSFRARKNPAQLKSSSLPGPGLAERFVSLIIRLTGKHCRSMMQ